jgi:inner membrane protein
LSPLIHAEIGWLLALPLARRRDRLLVVAAAVVPDVDGAGLLISDALYEEWHHRLAHGVIAAVVVTLLVLAWTRTPRAALLACAAFHSHIAMDLMGSGPGWPILYWWPFSSGEWLPSWQWNLASWQNSVFGLVATLVCLACAVRFGRTPVEIFSTKADARVVATLRARFTRKGASSSSS